MNPQSVRKEKTRRMPNTLDGFQIIHRMLVRIAETLYTHQHIMKLDRGVEFGNVFEKDVEPDGAQPGCDDEADAAHALFCVFCKRFASFVASWERYFDFRTNCNEQNNTRVTATRNVENNIVCSLYETPKCYCCFRVSTFNWLINWLVNSKAMLLIKCLRRDITAINYN